MKSPIENSRAYPGAVFLVGKWSGGGLFETRRVRGTFVHDAFLEKGMHKGTAFFLPAFCGGWFCGHLRYG